jgi:hypothetical protein
MMSKSVLNSNYLSKDEVPPYEVSKRQLVKQRRVPTNSGDRMLLYSFFSTPFLFKTEREKTMGKNWFDMKVGELNEETKNDLTVLKMRGSLFKDKFFKKNDSDVLPKYFEVLLFLFKTMITEFEANFIASKMGKIVDNPIDYYTDRVPKKQQKQTILEELVEDSKVRK